MPPKAKAKSGGKQLFKKVSLVQAIDDQGSVYKGFNIWSTMAPACKADRDLLFAKCAVQPGSTNEVLKCKQVEPEDPTEEVFDVPQEKAWNANSNINPMLLNDIGMIPHTNVPCVLDFMKCRYVEKEIYVTADPLLICINPFKNVGTGGDDYILMHRDAPDHSKLGPHTFGLSRTALDTMHSVRKSQTLIVSGESGAGKTEAVKMAMRYFAAAKSGKTDTTIQDAIMGANPVLEAFGNAKTIRNNNSSRFGRFMQLQVQAAGGMEYGSVRNFLLEKSRILHQEDTERSYHIFYQLLKAATPEQRTAWRLRDISGYNFINPACLDTPGMDDEEEWADCWKAYEKMGMPVEEQNSIYSILSAVLLFGNVNIGEASIDGVPNAGLIPDDQKATFKDACELAFLDPLMAEEGICVKISMAGGAEIRGRWTKPDTEMLMHSLAKALFDKLFDWFVIKLNHTIEPPGGFEMFMGMLDIFGFEVFKNNSLEQLFINVTNEMLQKNFTDVVFEKEQKLYKDEGISAADLVFTSNGEIIRVLTGPKNSLMTCLEDQCLAPGGNDEKFLSAAYKMLEGTTEKLVRSKVAGNVNFIIDHTVGEIQYNVENFLFKNKDVLRGELIEVVQASTNPVSLGLFEGVEVIKGKSAKGQLIGSQFLNQLSALMDLINSTEPHFIRCVKPNEEKLPLVFNQAKILIQLHALSILEALQLKNLGYSYRRPFTEFLFQFKFVDLGIAENPNLEPKVAAQKLLERASITEGIAIGKTMVFMKPEAMKAVAAKQRQMMASWGPLISVLESMWAMGKLKQGYATRHSPMSRIQALARRKIKGAHSPPSASSTLGWYKQQR
ncbi:MAG: uncharacterized protein KVP18_001882 [Porospora cf. gigantea A]|uniref:uncharacterized protein n=1 Tax=Porospora cf. gigantea A TaxID=2853593 RepID=UPI00355A72A3|nr:MAG: hypothetical protein KVP18_001882 [Porospora cf. gigantea A]